MKTEKTYNEDLYNIEKNLIQREKQEILATVPLTSEALSRLNISIDTLPHKHQQLLRSLSRCTTYPEPLSISLQQSKQESDQISQEFELLELKQKNRDLQKQIERNAKVIEGLRMDLEESRAALGSQRPNPDDVLEHVRLMKQKLASYEEIYQKAKVKYSKLAVPDAILPARLHELSTRLNALREEEETLRLQADDVTLAREARAKLSRLRR